MTGDVAGQHPRAARGHQHQRGHAAARASRARCWRARRPAAIWAISRRWAAIGAARGERRADSGRVTGPVGRVTTGPGRVVTVSHRPPWRNGRGRSPCAAQQCPSTVPGHHSARQQCPSTMPPVNEGPAAAEAPLLRHPTLGHGYGGSPYCDADFTPSRATAGATARCPPAGGVGRCREPADAARPGPGICYQRVGSRVRYRSVEQLPSRCGEGRDGALQEQPPGHRVQPVRGAAAAGRPRREPYADVDEETARGILDEVHRLADRPGRRVVRRGRPATRRSSTRPRTRSRMPEAFKRSYQAFIDAEWFRLELPSELGGTSVPRTIAWSVGRADPGGQPGGLDVRQPWLVLPGAVELGTPEQQKRRRARGRAAGGATPWC